MHGWQCLTLSRNFFLGFFDVLFSALKSIFQFRQYLIKKRILIDIQFPEIVLIVRKCAGKDGLNETSKCTSAPLNMIRCHGYKVGYLSSN